MHSTTVIIAFPLVQNWLRYIFFAILHICILVTMSRSQPKPVYILHVHLHLHEYLQFWRSECFHLTFLTHIPLRLCAFSCIFVSFMSLFLCSVYTQMMQQLQVLLYFAQLQSGIYAFAFKILSHRKILHTHLHCVKVAATRILPQKTAKRT